MQVRRGATSPKPRLIRADQPQITAESLRTLRITAAELVRTAAIAAVGDRPALADSDGHLIAQVEQIFRYVHVLATAKRNEMLKNGRDEELEELIRSAQALQGELKKRRPD